jgi:N-acetylmuramoyl-L-alanine amidase
MHWNRSLLALVLVLLVSNAPSTDEKRISIYSTAANYSLPLIERNGGDYIGLLELLDPLGSVSARSDGLHWKIRYNNVEGEFTSGKSRMRIRGKDFDLPANFLLEHGRGLVPVSSLSTLLPRFLGGPVTFHESARRLFVGSVATQFSTELSKTNPPRLIMNFTSPVNPTIATEPGKLRMVFIREPLLPPGAQTLNFADQTISSATFAENNGTAEITVVGDASLMATFSNDGRTITIAPAPQRPVPPVAPPLTVAAQSAPPMPPPAASTPPVSTAPVITAPNTNTNHQAPYLVVLDASHGGDERGAALTDKLAEKDVTLAITRRLKQELENRGISVLMLRDADATLSLDQRAALANNSRPALFVTVHASGQGNGVRLYTSLIPSGGENRGNFLDWDTAQSSFLPASQSALALVANELQKKQITVRTMSAPLRPLNSITAPAIALEVAPSEKDIAQLLLPDYQQTIAGAVANGVAALRDKTAQAGTQR